MSRHGSLGVLLPLGVTVALGLIVIVAVAGALADRRTDIDIPTSLFLLQIAGWAVIQAAVGTAIAWRRPGNRVGRVMQASGPLLIGAFLGYFIGAWRFAIAGPTDPVGGIAAWWASTTILGTVLLSFPIIGLLFPDGRLPIPRFRWPVRAAVAGVVGSSAVSALASGPIDVGLPENPFGIVALGSEGRELVGLVSTVALLATIVMAVAAIIVRWRRGDPLERAQLKWLLGAFFVAGVLFAISWAGPDAEPMDVIDGLSIASATLIPLAIGVAILRYRLYEIDRLVSRTLTYAAMSVLLFGVFFTTNLVLQSVISRIVTGNAIATAASTLLVAALFHPLRRRVQRLVDRRFHRAQYHADRTVEAFAERLRVGTDLPRLIGDLEVTAVKAVQPASTTVWIRRADPAG